MESSKYIQSLKILIWMGEHGIKYPVSEGEKAIEYVEKMIFDKRVIYISEDDRLKSMVFYSITDYPENFLKKKTWDYLEHNPRGRTVYIEKAVSDIWNKKIRKIMEEKMLEFYPQLTKAKWHRWAKWGDRQVTIRRKKDVLQNSYFS